MKNLKSLFAAAAALACASSAWAYTFVYNHTGISINGQLVGDAEAGGAYKCTTGTATWETKTVSAGTGKGNAWEIQLTGKGPYTVTGTANMQAVDVKGKDGYGGLGHSTWIRPMVDGSTVIAQNLTLSPLGRANCPTSTNAAFRVYGDSAGNRINVTLKLVGKNKFLGGERHPAVEVAAGGNTLTLAADTATASLCVTGGAYGAGISLTTTSSLSVNNCTLTAQGGNYGAGIGGNGGESGGTVFFWNGCTVRATGGFLAAGIGGGWKGDGHQVVMYGGDVYAKAGVVRAGTTRGMDVGCGSGASSAGSIRISGGQLYSAQQWTLTPGRAFADARMVASTYQRVYCVTLCDYACSALPDNKRMKPGVGYYVNSHGELDGKDSIRCVSATNAEASAKYNYTYSCNSPTVAYANPLDSSGKSALVSVWLPNGDYTISCGECRYRGTVNGANATFVPAYTTFDACDNDDPAKTTKTNILWTAGALGDDPPTAPTRAGYDFLGWFTEKTGGKEVDWSTSLYEIGSDMTVYGRYAKKDDFENSAVTTSEDSNDPYDGKVSLREKITWCAQQNYWTTVDVMSSLKTLMITNGPIVVGGGRINFWPSNGVALQGNDTDRLFVITGGVFQIKNMTLSHGSADADAPKGGGAVQITDGGLLQVENCRFSDNSAYGLGGAVYVRGTGSFTARNCTFYANALKDDGTLLAGSAVGAEGTDAAAPARVALIGCSIAGNKGVYQMNGGGAVYLKGAGAQAIVANVTCASNDNGGFYAHSSGLVYVLNSVFSNAKDGKDLYLSAVNASSRIINCLYSSRELTGSLATDVSGQAVYSTCLGDWTSTTVKLVRHSYYKPRIYAAGTGVKVLAASDPWTGLGYWACRGNGTTGYTEYLIGTSGTPVTTDLVGQPLVTMSGTDAYYPIGAVANAPAYAVSVTASDVPGAAATDGMVVSLETFGGSEPTSLRIPGVAQGLIIRKIAEDAFNSCETPAALYLPASLATVGNLAFANCTALTDVRSYGTAETCPSMLVEEAFANTPWLASGGLLKDLEGNVLKKYYATYTVMFDAEGGTGTLPDPMTCIRDRVYTLPKAELTNESYTFGGWDGSNGKRYDDGVMIFNAAAEGETLELHAFWAKPAE